MFNKKCLFGTAERMGYLACLLAIYTAVSARADVIENLVFTGTATCTDSTCGSFGSGPITGTYSLDVTTQTIVGAWSFSTPFGVISSSLAGATATNGVRLGYINPHFKAGTSGTFYEFLQLFFPIADTQEIGALPTNVYAPPIPGAPTGSNACVNIPGTSTCDPDYAVTGVTALAAITGCTFGLALSSASVSPAGANSSVSVMASPPICPWTALSNVPWITTSATGTGDGTAGFTVAANAGAARSGTLSIAGQLFTVNQAGGAAAAEIALSPAKLQFGYSGQLITGTQTVALNFTPSAAIAWTASSNQSNVSVSPNSGTGNAVLQITASPSASGIITVTAPGASNSPQQIQVNVTSVAIGLPYGSFDTPVNNTTGIAGAIPVTGWALDNVEVTSVGIYREPVGNEPTQPNGLVYIGNGTFVAHARPDVEATYPSAPLNYRGGWGYMLLTNFLPNASGSGASGNGTYKLHAIVTNKAGQALDLGTRTITVDNAHASKPFGTIDTPVQGGTVSGNAYVNFGWALTQNPYAIATDGSTITVILDGVPVGHPVYNNFRSDIANLFPGLANSNGAVGFFMLDTTGLKNGVHSISWNVFDNAARGDGVGSRYFTVFNAGGAVAAPQEAPTAESLTGPIRWRSGYDLNAPAAALAPDITATYSVEMEQLGRIELSLGASRGYLVVDGEAKELPIGSTLKAGVFYWQAPLGFLGKYELMFERPDGAQMHFRVNIVPKQYLLQ